MRIFKRFFHDVRDDTTDSSHNQLALEKSPPDENGSVLLGKITTAIRSHVIMDDGDAEVAALWVLHAHAHNAAQFSPLFAIVSPDMGCGKTTLLRVLAKLTPSALPTCNITPAGLYREIDRRKPTLLIDEGDTMGLGKNELRCILDSGHCRYSAYVLRSNGKFGVWCPKAIALIGVLPATLRDRSIQVTLKRKRREETVALLDGPALARLEQLGERAARWAANHFDDLAASNPTMPDSLINRAADNWRPLLAIAAVAGLPWRELAHNLAIRAAAEAQTEVTPGIALLSDIKTVFRAIRSDPRIAAFDRIPTADLLIALAAIEDSPWSQWVRGRAITAIQLAQMLKPYGILPKTIRLGTVTAKGYLMADFEDAFERYL